MNGDMATDPQTILARVDDILADLSRPDPERTGVDGADPDQVDLDTVGQRLEAAHQVLVEALESVEKG